MKRALVSIAVFVLLFSTTVLGQASFTCTIQNQNVSGSNFIFDIYMLSTGATPIYLAFTDLVVTFNDANFTSPTYSIVSIGGTNLANDLLYTLDPTIVSGNRAILNIDPPSVTLASHLTSRCELISSSGNGTRIATMQISGISNISGTAGIQWRTSGGNICAVNTFRDVSPWDSYTITGSGTFTNPGDYSLPVQMSSINASTNKKEGVVVTWATHSETDCAGFNVLRGSSENGKYQAVTTAMLPGQGNSSTNHEYRFVDRNVENGKTYWYKIMEISTDGRQKMHGPISVEAVSPVPNEYALSNGYPNPFNPVVTMTYQLPETGQVQVNVFNSRGELMKVLAEGTQEAGYYTVTWNGKRNDGMQAPSGMYFIRMQAGSFNKMQKVMLLK